MATSQNEDVPSHFGIFKTLLSTSFSAILAVFDAFSQS